MQNGQDHIIADILLLVVSTLVGCGSSLETNAVLDKKCPGVVSADSPTWLNELNCTWAISQRSGVHVLTATPGLLNVPIPTSELTWGASACPGGRCNTVRGAGTTLGRNGEVYDAATGACLNCGGTWSYWRGPQNSGYSISRGSSTTTTLIQSGSPLDEEAQRAARTQAQWELEQAIQQRNKTPGQN